MEQNLIYVKEKKGARVAKPLFIILAVLLVVAIILLNVFTHLLPIVRYYGSGMEPTLKNGQVLLVSKTAKIREGDIVAFYYNNKVLVRRAVCLGGSYISIAKDGLVTIDNQAIEETYLDRTSIGQCNLSFPHYVLPNHVFVMGDNREASMDSRLTEIGDIPMDRVIGKVINK